MMTPDDTTDSIPADELLALVIHVPAIDDRPGIVLSQREAHLFLTMSAVEFWNAPCDDLHCEVCYEFVTSWKSVYQALDADARLAVENSLEAYNVRAPSHPQGIR